MADKYQRRIHQLTNEIDDLQQRKKKLGWNSLKFAFYMAITNGSNNILYYEPVLQIIYHYCIFYSVEIYASHYASHQLNIYLGTYNFEYNNTFQSLFNTSNTTLTNLNSYNYNNNNNNNNYPASLLENNYQYICMTIKTQLFGSVYWNYYDYTLINDNFEFQKEIDKNYYYTHPNLGSISISYNTANNTYNISFCLNENYLE